MNILRILPALGILAPGECAAPCGRPAPHGVLCHECRHGPGQRIWAALKGADAHCTKLAEAAGSTGRTWRAYLSTQVEEGRAISARDRIGSGPWYNARGKLIAVDLDQLHINPNIVKRTALDENGDLVNGRGDRPNRHDILTGTKDDGTAYFPWQEGDHTCNNWTSSAEGSAQVGHHDRHGGGNISWNSAHASRGCSQEVLVSTGGAGLLYCFAAD